MNSNNAMNSRIIQALFKKVMLATTLKYNAKHRNRT